MKEKTFEELILEKVKSENWFIPTDVGSKFIVELMQLVREATIAECVEIIFDKWNNAIPVIRELPTDRIKTEK